MKSVWALIFVCAARATAADIPLTPEAKLRAEKQERKAVGVALLGAPLPFIPPKYALDSLAPQTFSRGPYRGGDNGYVNAGSRAASFVGQGSAQLIVNGGRADHAFGQLRTESRIGLDFSYSAYEARALATLRRSDYLRGHLVTSLLEREDMIFEAGFGGGTMQRDRADFGPSWVLNYELYNCRPWTFSARYEPTYLFDGRFYHEFRAEAGVAFWRLGLSAGARAFLNPLRNAWGPEGSLRFWF